MHTNKRANVSGRARLADSSDIWDIARSVLMMGRDKNSEKLYLSHEKSSLLRPGPDGPAPHRAGAGGGREDSRGRL
ncbi:MAG: hypothetical protein ACLUGP_13515 [Faecalibacterium prausnitzii]